MKQTLPLSAPSCGICTTCPRVALSIEQPNRDQSDRRGAAQLAEKFEDGEFSAAPHGAAAARGAAVDSEDSESRSREL